MRADSANVIARPPLMYLATLVVALLLHWLHPVHAIASPVLARGAGGLLLALGIGIVVWGRNQLRRAGTNINPTLPTTAIVSSGPYRFVRNPLYVGLTLVFLGLTVVIDTAWALVLLVPLLIAMHFGVVLREERYLESKFGTPYREYKAQVRRYL